MRALPLPLVPIGPTRALEGLPCLAEHPPDREACGDAMEVDRNGLEVLDRMECLRLLGQATVGRIAVTVGALPVILPINFRVIEDRIVFRTGIGSKLHAATDNAVVAFEVDEIEMLSHSGWSVTVTGTSRAITDPAELASIDVDSIPRWAPMGLDRVAEVSSDLVSGRRLRPWMAQNGMPGSHHTGPDTIVT